MNKKIKKFLIGFFLLFYVIIVLVQISKKTKSINTGTDFYVFWFAGHNFYSGNDLYIKHEGVNEYIYPPQAAFFFQFFALFPYQISAGIFLIFNAAAPFLCAWLIYKILLKFGWEPQKTKKTVALSSLVCINYIWSNFSMNQVNYLIFLLILTALYFYVYHKSAFVTVPVILATFIKIIPILFLPFFIFKNFRIKAILITGVFFLFMLFLPILQRGWQQGIQDYLDYYTEFLVQYQKGKVGTKYTNQNLSAAVYRSVATAYDDQYSAIISPSKIDLANTLTKVFSVLLICIYIHILFLSRKSNTETLILSSSIIILIMHLLSGITWKAHLVTLQWVYIFFLHIRSQNFKNIPKIMYYILFTLIAICGFESSDIIGWHLHKQFGNYNFFVWVMILLLLFYYVILLFGKKSFLMTVNRQQEIH